MKDLAKETVKKIKEEQIKPKAKWKFLVENLLIWSSLAFFIIIGALTFSLAYFFLNQLDWDVISFGWHMPFRMFFGLLPNFWLILLVIFLIAAFFLYRHTKRGYRIGIFSVVLLLLLLFLMLGFAAHFFNTDRNLNNIFSKKIPGYAQLSNNKEKQWSQPEVGLLGGKILQVKESSFGLKDFQGEDWQVNYDENTLIKPSVNLAENNEVKIIGEKKADQEFQAKEIRPWEGKGMMRGKMGGERGGNKSGR